MQDNDVASYYDTFNEYYKTYGKDVVNNSSIIGMAKSFGADSYIPQGSDININEHVTTKTIDGLFKEKTPLNRQHLYLKKFLETK